MSYPNAPCFRRPFWLTVLPTLAALLAAGVACDTFPLPSNVTFEVTSDDPRIAALLAPAPKLPPGFYDYFGTLKSPVEARRMVEDAGLDPAVDSSYARIGLVHITEKLLADGRDRFFRQNLGDPFTMNRLLFRGRSVIEATLEGLNPAEDENGLFAFLRDLVVTLAVRPKVATTNVQVINTSPLRLGTRVFPPGTLFDTGLDVAAGELIPVGLEGGVLSCGTCHASVDPGTGRVVVGAPNVDLNTGLVIAAFENSAGIFLKINQSDFDPRDPRWPRTGRRIIDSNGNPFVLPDPIAFEQAIDDFLLTVALGGFDAGPDGVTALTKIPDSFVFGEGGMGWDGGFQIGPFAGAAAFTSAVHSFEVNVLSPRFVTQVVNDLDPEIYLGTVLQNAADPALRIPDDVRPSEWLAANFPVAERELLVALPQLPDPTLFTLNGLIFSPPGETFMHSVNAVAAFQQSLSVPPNRSLDNLVALQSGAVVRGAEVFAAANCGDCHAPPFFTDGRIIRSDVLKTNAVRGRSRRVLEGRLVEAVLPSFDQPVPLPDPPNLLLLPPDPSSPNTLVLPPGLDGDDGGYKVAGLLGLYLKAPYLHDGGVAVSTDALVVSGDGSYTVVNPAGVGVPGTRRQRRPISAAHSLRALLDRDLRAMVVANNAADPVLLDSGIQGVGHDFYVDPAAGFTDRQQSDLIAFLLALDDHPGAY